MRNSENAHQNKSGVVVCVNRPFAGSGYMIQNKLQWDANDGMGLPKQKKTLTSPARLSFVLEVI